MARLIINWAKSPAVVRAALSALAYYISNHTDKGSLENYRVVICWDNVGVLYHTLANNDEQRVYFRHVGSSHWVCMCTYTGASERLIVRSVDDLGDDEEKSIVRTMAGLLNLPSGIFVFKQVDELA